MENLFTSGLLTAAIVTTAAGTVSAAEKIVIEAESPEASLLWQQDTKNKENSQVSQQKGLKLDDVHRDNYARYKFNADEAGTYDLSVYYITCNTRWVMFQVNGKTPQVVRFDNYTPNWDGTPDGDRPGVAKMTFTVDCVKGENTLEMKAIYCEDEPYTPTIDRFELEKSEGTSLADSFVLTQECEDCTTKEGSANNSETKNAFSGKKGMGFSDKDGKATYSVNVPEAGAYLMTIHYATLQDRWITVRANRQETIQEIKFAKNSQDWANKEGEWLGHRAVVLYLDKGDNTITLGQCKSHSPNLDLFTLEKVNLSYELDKPKSILAMHKASLADIASWKSDDFSDLANLHDHDETTLATATAANPSVILEFPSPALISGFCVATPDDIADWKAEISNDGTQWTELSTEYREQITDGDIHTFILKTRTTGEKYFRLSKTGETASRLGDIAVFGNLSSRLDGGILPANFTEYENSHPGFDEGSWHEGIDKLFDGNPNSQYTVRGQDMGGQDIEVTVFLSEPCMIKSYALSTHNSSEYKTRSPREWTLRAWKENTEVRADGDFVAIDTRTGMNFAAPASTLVMAVDNPVESDTYKLSLTNRNNTDTHLSMFQLYADNKLDAKPDQPTGITETGLYCSYITVCGHTVNVYPTDNGSICTIASIDGKTIVSTPVQTNRSFELSSGVYVVRLDNKSVKVIIRD